MVRINPVGTWKKKMFILLIPQEILAWPPGLGLKVKGESRPREKLDDSVVRMRPHELFLPQGWAFMFIFIYKGLRVGVRVRVTGPHPKVYPWCHLLDHVITPMSSSLPWSHSPYDVTISGGWGFPGRLIFDLPVMWPLAACWLVHLYHVTNIWLSDWSVPKWPPLLLTFQP